MKKFLLLFISVFFFLNIFLINPSQANLASKAENYAVRAIAIPFEKMFATTSVELTAPIISISEREILAPLAAVLNYGYQINARFDTKLIAKTQAKTKLTSQATISVSELFNLGANPSWDTPILYEDVLKMLDNGIAKVLLKVRDEGDPEMMASVYANLINIAAGLPEYIMSLDLRNDHAAIFEASYSLSEVLKRITDPDNPFYLDIGLDIGGLNEKIKNVMLGADNNVHIANLIPGLLSFEMAFAYSVIHYCPRHGERRFFNSFIKPALGNLLDVFQMLGFKSQEEVANAKSNLQGYLAMIAEGFEKYGFTGFTGGYTGIDLSADNIAVMLSKSPRVKRPRMSALLATMYPTGDQAKLGAFVHIKGDNTVGRISSIGEEIITVIKITGDLVDIPKTKIGMGENAISILPGNTEKGTLVSFTETDGRISIGTLIANSFNVASMSIPTGKAFIQLRGFNALSAQDQGNVFSIEGIDPLKTKVLMGPLKVDTKVIIPAQVDGSLEILIGDITEMGLAGDNRAFVSLIGIDRPVEDPGWTGMAEIISYNIEFITAFEKYFESHASGIETAFSEREMDYNLTPFFKRLPVYTEIDSYLFKRAWKAASESLLAKLKELGETSNIQPTPGFIAEMTRVAKETEFLVKNRCRGNCESAAILNMISVIDLGYRARAMHFTEKPDFGNPNRFLIGSVKESTHVVAVVEDNLTGQWYVMQSGSIYPVEAFLKSLLKNEKFFGNPVYYTDIIQAVIHSRTVANNPISKIRSWIRKNKSDYKILQMVLRIAEGRRKGKF